MDLQRQHYDRLRNRGLQPLHSSCVSRQLGRFWVKQDRRSCKKGSRKEEEVKGRGIEERDGERRRESETEVETGG